MLPIEIRLNILEYQGDHLSMCVRDKDIIDRIRRYDPSFDHQEWIDIVRRKKKFIEQVCNSPLLPLYKYIITKDIQIVKTYGSHIVLGKRRDTIIDESKFDTLKQSYQDVDISIHRDDITIYSSDMDSICSELTRIRTLLHPRNDIIYNGSYRDISFIDDINILHIPLTLSEYLRFAIDRQKEYSIISKHPLYPVYQILDKYEWSMDKVRKLYSSDCFYKIISGNITQDDADKVLKILEGIMDKNAITALYTEIGSTYHIDDKGAYDLYRIDRYYHPYVPILWK